MENYGRRNPSYHFIRTPIRQVVETRVYRPDKYKKDKPEDSKMMKANSI